jgi:hypothetical protein
VVFDIEVYRNYFLVAFKNLHTGKVLTYELFADGSGNFDADEIRFLMKNRVTIGFNSRGFDLPILYMALDGAPIALLKEAANAIIEDGLKPWEIERRYGVLVPKRIEHIDLIEVAPGQASLKIYGGRLHAPRMQDLPIKPDARLTDRECRIICRYCINDLDNTELLFNDLKSEVELRITVGEEYGQDLRSKSDAQIAETVIKSRMAEILGDVPKRPEIAAGRVYRYRVPSYIKFEHPALKAVLEDVREAEFVVAPSGKVLMPDALAKAKIKIGGGVYRMGIGGLHSSEKRRSHFADDDTLLIDRDVASYYPAIILTLGLFPKHLGKPFLKVYRRIVERRLVAKARTAEIKKRLFELKVMLEKCDE